MVGQLTYKSGWTLEAWAERFLKTMGGTGVGSVSGLWGSGVWLKIPLDFKKPWAVELLIT